MSSPGFSPGTFALMASPFRKKINAGVDSGRATHRRKMLLVWEATAVPGHTGGGDDGGVEPGVVRGQALLCLAARGGAAGPAGGAVRRAHPRPRLWHGTPDS